VDVLLNDMPSSIKSYHTLDYEGSQSRVEGIKRIDVDSTVYTGASPLVPDGSHFYFTSDEWDILLDIIDPTMTSTSVTNISAESNIDIKQYRNNILIKSGPIKIWNNTDGIHGRWNDGVTITAYDWEVGDVITTQHQEDSIHAIGSDLFNSTPTDGWYVSNIKTNKEEGSLNEFIEKEGKWFNYIKGVESAIGSDTDFGSFDIQGLGVVSDITNNDVTIDGDLNTSIQVGDKVYYQTPTVGTFTTLDSSSVAIVGTVESINGNVITLDAVGSLAADDYCMFVKNQVINMNGLSGYYAEAKFKNNSTSEAELFSVSSEVTESSK